MSAQEIDPSKVKAGDTVTVTHPGEDVEVRGRLHDHQAGYFWSIRRAGTFYARDGWTLTDHQPAEPEWKPGTVPTREQFTAAFAGARGLTLWPGASGRLTDRSAGLLADAALALFEQGGAAPKVTGKQLGEIAEELYGGFYRTRGLSDLRNALERAGIEVSE